MFEKRLTHQTQNPKITTYKIAVKKYLCVKYIAVGKYSTTRNNSEMRIRLNKWIVTKPNGINHHIARDIGPKAKTKARKMIMMLKPLQPSYMLKIDFPR